MTSLSLSYSVFLLTINRLDLNDTTRLLSVHVTSDRP